MANKRARGAWHGDRGLHAVASSRRRTTLQPATERGARAAATVEGQQEQSTFEVLAEQQRSRLASEVDLIRARRQLKLQEQATEAVKARAAATERRLLAAKAALQAAVRETEEATRRGSAAVAEQQRLQREVAELLRCRDVQKDLEEVVRDAQRERDELRAHVERLLALSSSSTASSSAATAAAVAAAEAEVNALKRRSVALETELAGLRAAKALSGEEERRRLQDLKQQHEELLQKHQELLVQHQNLQKQCQEAQKKPPDDKCENEQCHVGLEEKISERPAEVTEPDSPSIASLGSSSVQRIPSLDQTRQALFPQTSSAPECSRGSRAPGDMSQKESNDVVAGIATSKSAPVISENLKKSDGMTPASFSEVPISEEETDRVSRPLSPGREASQLEMQRELYQCREMLRVQVGLTHMYKEEVEKLCQEVLEKQSCKIEAGQGDGPS